MIKNTTVIRNEELEPQYHLLVTEFFTSKPKQKGHQKFEERIKWNKLETDSEDSVKFADEMKLWLNILIEQDICNRWHQY